MVQWAYSTPNFTDDSHVSDTYNEYGILEEMTMLTGHKIRCETNALTQVEARTIAERLTESYNFVCDIVPKLLA